MTESILDIAGETTAAKEQPVQTTEAEKQPVQTTAVEVAAPAKKEAPKPKVGELPDFISEMVPPAEAQYIRAWIYGPPGIGKTRLCASADDVESARDIMFLDIEAGVMSIRDRKFKKPRPSTWAQIKQIVEWLLQAEHTYHTVVLDSLTDINAIVMKSIIEEDLTAHPTRDRDIPTLQDYLRAQVRMTRLIQVLKRGKFHLLCTAHPQDQKDELTGVVTTMPSLPGKLPRMLAQHFDVIGYMFSAQAGTGATSQLADGTEEKAETPIRMLFQPTRTIDAKDRSGALPPVMVDPSFPKIYNLIHKK